MAATVRDVARRAGVSAMTVSRVVNDRSGVAPETRARIEEAIRELEFSPSKVANGLTSSRTQLVGLIVPDVTNPFFASVVHGVEIALRRESYRVLLCNSENDLRLEADYIADLVAHRVDGLVVAPAGERSLGHLQRLSARGFPLVLFDRVLDRLSCDSVALDNIGAAERLVAHLTSLGHREIALIMDSSEVSTARDRLAGASQALAAQHLSPHIVVRASADRLGGYGAAQHIIARPTRPTAIVAVNNMTAMGAMQALREAGIRVPEDISLVCFDDVPHLALVSPFLTVIDQPAEEMAQVAAQLLVERMQGTVTGDPRSVRFQGRLVARQSSARV